MLLTLPHSSCFSSPISLLSTFSHGHTNGLNRYASTIGESYCDDCIEVALERAESTRHHPSSLHLSSLHPSSLLPFHPPTHSDPINGSLHEIHENSGRAQQLLVSALAKDKDKDKDRNGINKRTATFGTGASQHSHHSHDSDEDTALTGATGLNSIHDHNQSLLRLVG